MKNLISVSRAARIADVSPSTIYKLLASGKIRGFRATDKLVRIWVESLNSYLAAMEATPYARRPRIKA